MQYRVFWTPHAEDRLAELLKKRADAPMLVAAAREIDQRLIKAPSEFGESRYEQIRIGFIYPLGVQFEVMDDVQTVIVHDTWRLYRR